MDLPELCPACSSEVVTERQGRHGFVACVSCEWAMLFEYGEPHLLPAATIENET